MRRISIWPLLIKFSAVISLISGVLYILQLIISLQKDKMVPFWLFVTSSLTSFLCGLFLSFWLQKRFKRIWGAKLNKLGQISFDYLPIPLIEKGWKIHYKKDVSSDKRQVPDFTVDSNSPVPGSLNISPTCFYGLDYYVQQNMNMANIVDYYIKPISRAVFYLRVKVSSIDQSTSKCVWIAHILEEGKPEKVNDNEWNYFDKGDILENGWRHITSSLEDEVRDTYGREGLVYRGLERIRLRGELSISPITLNRIEA